ncbi:MAG: hypothetical protein AAGU76_08195 [Sedimentibacter sp.]|uniref:hypothetical protein n=1 Tax=Sedimentibacter sp. TaxID=1960295 RepID=UPI0031583ECD
MDISQYLDLVDSKLKNSFDVSRNTVVNGINYDLYAQFKLRNERYVLTKKAVVYAFENNEYCLVKHFQKIDERVLDSFTEELKKSVECIVSPSSEHMSSIITAVAVTDNMPPGDFENLKGKVERFRYNKGFAFGFKGWADIRLLLVSLDEGLTAANKKGKEVAKVYSA